MLIGIERGMHCAADDSAWRPSWLEKNRRCKQVALHHPTARIIAHELQVQISDECEMWRWPWMVAPVGVTMESPSGNAGALD